MNKLSLAIATVLFLFSTLTVTSADASVNTEGIMIGANFFKFDQGRNGPTLGDYDQSITMITGKIGYTMTSGLYIGGIYDSRTDEASGSKLERTGFGATVGYHNMGWFLDASYFLSSAMKASGGVEIKEGSGFGFDLGRNFDLTDNIFIGLQISWKSFTYKKVNSNDETNKIKSDLMPMLNLGLTF